MKGYREQGGHWLGHRQQTHERLRQKTTIFAGYTAPSLGTRAAMSHQECKVAYVGCPTSSGSKVAREVWQGFLGSEHSGGRLHCGLLPRGLQSPF